MHQIITDQKLFVKVLNQAFERWEAQRNPEVHNEEKTVKPSELEANDDLQSRVSVKSDLKFLDASMPNQSETALTISETIRKIIANLSEKYQGSNVIEKEGITEID